MYEPALSFRFSEALAFAYTAHATQRRKGTDIPYLGHVLGVASLVIDHGGTEDEAIAGLLHDVPEDCGGRLALEDIRRKFGSDVAAIVEGCTDTFENPKPEWKTRKTAYIEHLRNASASVRLVAAADKLHNARTIVSDHKSVGSALWSRFSVSDPFEILWYYQGCADALTGMHRVRLWEDLSSTVNQLRDCVRSRES